ncbi:lipopolysaccharide biosynthesis protein [Enterococcus alcedinis]|uniref:Polysaccharide biosynthesis protein n=1 Tax=Enterococcus alcedinis TaxID=1274384 RepID=A0A917JIK8_9ENTE|nr:oligosaccharide flippase family protein [Enterococcus alcedinis]MBP2102765.1 O-antigen/teichoic acid export membrane protein [Enterococcus alcedinis]GGI66326.1 hypothetical protein GCM10011482_19800 [Enterococcus alcedinis]
MEKLLKKFVGFSVGPMIAAVISFITVPIITYFVSPEEFGKASMFTVVQTLVASFIFLGMDQSYTREYHYVENKIKLFQNAVMIPLMVSSIFIFIGVIFRSQISFFLFENSEYHFISILFGFMLVFMILERFILLSIRMEERALEYSFYSVVVKVVVFIVTLLMLYYGERNFLTIVYSTIFGQIVGDILLIIVFRKLFKFNFSYFDRTLMHKMFVFGIPIIIAASLYSFLNAIGRFFLRGNSTFTEIGIYTAALKVAGILTLVQTMFTSFWVPLAYRWHKEEKGIKYYSYMSNLILFIMTLVFFFVVFFKKYIILILAPEYRQAAFATALLSLAPILYTVSETTTLGIVFSGKSQYNALTSFISIFPAIFLNYLLVPNYGTVGASIATAVSYVFFYFFRTYFSKKCGFNINTTMQNPVILLLLTTSIINAFDVPGILYYNILLFIVSILLQYGVINSTMDIVKNSREWDFS